MADTLHTQFVEGSEDLSWVLIKPRLSEKAANLGSQNIYTFDVATRANKIQIKKAIELYYKVKPLRVNVINNEGKMVNVRGNRGKRAATKKAMVFLPQGKTIDFV